VRVVRTVRAPRVSAAPVAPAVLAEMRALQKHGLLVSPLAGALASRPLYGYTLAKPGENALLVTVPQRVLTPEGLLPVAVLNRLRSQQFPVVVNLAGTRVSDAGLRQLGGVKRPMGLNLELCGRLTDGGLEGLGRLPNLRVLFLTGTGVSAEGLRPLASLKTLSALDLEVCESIGDAACEVLGGMPQLRALVLKKTGFEPTHITDAGVKHLGRLTALESLSLYGNRITDRGLAHLAGLSRLRELDLSLLAISDAGLVHLRGLGELRKIDLLYSEGFAGPKLTDGAAEALAGLIHLEGLNLTGARLTDAGLARLAGLKELKTLRLVRTGISGEGLRAFKSTVPGCEVVR
jgi:hypothetical protein